MMNKICGKCEFFYKYHINIFKKDNRPIIYSVDCGMTPGRNTEFKECEYFKKKIGTRIRIDI